MNNGIESASGITIVTICKLVPLFYLWLSHWLVFMSIFSQQISGKCQQPPQSGASVSLWSQIKGCLMVMMWVFVGIEGASVLPIVRKTVGCPKSISHRFAFLTSHLCASFLIAIRRHVASRIDGVTTTSNGQHFALYG